MVLLRFAAAKWSGVRFRKSFARISAPAERSCENIVSEHAAAKCKAVIPSLSCVNIGIPSAGRSRKSSLRVSKLSPSMLESILLEAAR